MGGWVGGGVGGGEEVLTPRTPPPPNTHTPGSASDGDTPALPGRMTPSAGTQSNTF